MKETKINKDQNELATPTNLPSPLTKDTMKQTHLNQKSKHCLDSLTNGPSRRREKKRKRKKRVDWDSYLAWTGS